MSKVRKAFSGEKMIDFFQNKGLNFKTLPNFGTYVSELERKTSGKYFLTRTISNINIKSIETPEEYFSIYDRIFPNISITEDVLEEVYKAAIFWGIECEPSNFTPEEIITIIVTRLYTIHCNVLYKNDIAPNSNAIYDRTIISYVNGHFTKLICIR